MRLVLLTAQKMAPWSREPRGREREPLKTHRSYSIITRQPSSLNGTLVLLFPSRREAYEAGRAASVFSKEVTL